MRVPSSARLRPLLAVTSGLLVALLAWSPVLAAITWGSTYRLSPYDATSSQGFAGMSLKRTVTSGGTAYLHTAYIPGSISGDPVQDDGPYKGVYYRRGNASGSSWGTPRRLNASTEHGENAAVAASGSRVYVAWSTQTHIAPNWSSSDPRLVRVRVNTSHGASDKWRSRVNLTSSGKVDRPAIAASGSKVYVVYTESGSGEIRLHRSLDYGVTWQPYTTIGAANLGTGGNQYSYPVVAATGDTVLVAWSSMGGIVARTSTNAGASFGSPIDVSASESLDLSIAARSGRVTIAWMEQEKGGWIRTWKASTGFGTTRKFATFSSSATYKAGYSPSVTLIGTNQVGVAYAGCLKADCSASSSTGVNLLWRESIDGGASWKSRKTIATYSAGSSRRVNDLPSALYTSTTRRVVLWNAHSASYASEHLRVRVGTGAP